MVRYFTTTLCDEGSRVIFPSWAERIFPSTYIRLSSNPSTEILTSARSLLLIEKPRRCRADCFSSEATTPLVSTLPSSTRSRRSGASRSFLASNLFDLTSMLSIIKGWRSTYGPAYRNVSTFTPSANVITGIPKNAAIASKFLNFI